ncbi:hypothetical protein [Gephyromycinifex aptenodytis]|uniref:hypothetical protein n=1 Tax=Gephyromycinifex aptenodytis TaxID=2716227 RepID=UPI00144582E7|nr:hypothetical protein [Gephyromycinifex aptenodytis]
MVALHAVYRSYAGDNNKSRPLWFSKMLAAASFARSAEQAGIFPVWLNDGPLPLAWTSMQHRYGTVHPIAGGPKGMRNSYVTALRFAIDSNWPDEDVVYFSEDDYLHTPDALSALAAAAQEMPDVAYFALYASAPGFAAEREWPEGYQYPQEWKVAPARTAAGRQWLNVASTASTFAARVGALRADYRMFRLCMFPFRHMFLDHETCLLYQGHRPYRGREYFTGLTPLGTGPIGTIKTALLTPCRFMLNAAAKRNENDPHHLYAVVPNLGCHMEVGVMTPGQDWEALALQTARWAADEGIMPLPSWAKRHESA